MAVESEHKSVGGTGVNETGDASSPGCLGCLLLGFFERLLSLLQSRLFFATRERATFLQW